MAEQIFKELKTKIALKTLTFSEWDAIKDTYKPLRGEVCVCEIPTGTTVPTANSVTPPTVLFKVGDGVNVWSALNWASALAADVYSWAKKPTLDVNDLPTLPITIVDPDAATKKFITGISYADNKLTITRSDVDWGDVQNKPNLVNSVKVTDDDVVITGTPVNATSGDVTIDIKHKAYNKAGATTDVAGDATTAGSSVTIKVPTLTVDAYGHTEFTGETSHTITIPSEVAVGDGNITITAGDGLAEGGSFNVNQDSDATITLKHADTSSVANVTAADRTYVKSLTFDDFGHVTAVDVGTETVVDTDTQYHVEYDSTNKKIKLVAGADANKMEIPTDDFIKDGMISSVAISEDGKNLVITWNSDAGKDVTNIPLTELVDIMTGVDGTTIKVEVSADDKISAEVKTESIKDGHIAKDAAIAETKLAKGIQDALALARTALQSHQDITGKADKVTGAIAGNFAGLDANGNLVDSGKKAADFQPAGNYQPAGSYKTVQEAVDNKITKAAHVLTSLTQDANGVIDYSVKELTPAVIGAAPADDYLTEVIANNTETKHSGLKVTDKNKIEIDDEVIFILNANF